ncbi:MAG: ABC transporter ATP-binding protein [Chitinophagaceae bacterium]
MPSTVLRATALSKSFGDFHAVKQLDFAVKQGEVYGFLGQNGAGKSTTLRMVLSLIRPSSGNIEVFGKSLMNDRNYILSRIGAVIEKPELYGYLSAYKNLEIFARLSGVSPNKDLLMQTLKWVGLDERAHDPVRVYSQGMKQRLGIAVALVHDPELIILDEPTNGLDPQGISDIRNMILDLSRNKRKTVIVSSHLLSEIEQVADSLLIIHKGQKAVEGEVAKLLRPEKSRVEWWVSDSRKALSVLYGKSNAAEFNQLDDHKFVAVMPASETAHFNAILVENGIEVRAIRSMNALEAYFLSLTSEHAV